MAAVEVTIRATEYDLLNRTQRQVVLIGEAMLTGLGVGGGPMPPGPGNPPGIWGGSNEPFPGYGPPEGGPGGNPPGIWGGPIDPYPGHPLPGRPPGIWGGGNQPFPTPPIYFPPNVPPSVTPPEPPHPGDPTTPLPPPAGSAGWPVQPIQPPAYMVVWYPGIGPVVVAPPEHQEPTPSNP